MNDRELLEQIQSGDVDAFRHFYELNINLVYRYALVRVGKPAVAEDIAAETFLKAWEAFPRFRWRGKPLRSWLLRITYNLIMDQFRANQRWFNSLPLLHKLEPEKNFPKVVEERDVIRRAFQTLSYDEQIILFLHYYEGQTLKEIAGILDKSANAVRVAKFRALKRLEKYLNESER